ncbi:toxin biosynthesis [Phlyctema vagabunda]|uniref:Toxin biosynthesis n=1 Tax=Phlyctema vagabunda TaxID=108571 RepID=A0ABR4PBS6_9HELO
MSSSYFQVKEHVIECQHIREYARATAHTQNEALHLAIKQYTPLDNLSPQEGDVTIIGTHANAFPKELYEALWDDLLARSKKNGFRIRSIWIADVAQQGASGILNENLLGDDPSWTDHARDLLHMINHFRKEMPRPLVGLGHSFGSNILVNLAFMHPRLLSTLVLLDPVIQEHASSPHGPSPAQQSTFRRDLWPSRKEAEAAMRKQKFYQAWDPRVLESWLQYGIRETPTALYPNEQGAVTLSTTKHQECFTFLRPSWEGMSADGESITNRDLVPDLNLKGLTKFPFYRPEPPATVHRLPELRPSTLYIFGAESPMSQPDTRKIKMETTGVGLGGSGGAEIGRVKEVLLRGVGHLVAMEASEHCAEAAAAWFGQELKRYDEEQQKYVQWAKQSLADKSTMSEEWKKRVGGPLKPPRSKI